MQRRNRFDPSRRVEQDLTHTLNAAFGGRIPGFHPNQVADRGETIGYPAIGLANRKVSRSLGAGDRPDE
jgi:hypothetical protein